MRDDTQDIAEGVVRMGLGTARQITPLSGGVSCDVYRVETDTGVMVVKRALPKLRVTADWRAPPERWRAEVAWLELVAAIDPHWVPRVFAQDAGGYMFAMQYLPPDNHPVWKAELAAGRAGGPFAQEVGARLARIHAETAGRAGVAAAFDNGAQFHALRLEPYLLFTAERHPFVAPAIRAEVARIAGARIALMQGDISPKNILCGPNGPVFLDAETACYGDPAFDVAFCMNHFLLKAVWHPEYLPEYQAGFAAMTDAYLAAVTWEDPAQIERRIARLLPMLFLARVDGKSPVEYLTDEDSRAFVRGAALQMILEPPYSLDILAQAYFPAAAQR